MVQLEAPAVAAAAAMSLGLHEEALKWLPIDSRHSVAMLTVRVKAAVIAADHVPCVIMHLVHQFCAQLHVFKRF